MASVVIEILSGDLVQSFEYVALMPGSSPVDLGHAKSIRLVGTYVMLPCAETAVERLRYLCTENGDLRPRDEKREQGKCHIQLSCVDSHGRKSSRMYELEPNVSKPLDPGPWTLKLVWAQQETNDVEVFENYFLPVDQGVYH